MVAAALLFFPPWRDSAGLPVNPFWAVFAIIMVYLFGTNVSSLLELFKPDETRPDRPFETSDAPGWLQQIDSACAALEGSRSKRLEPDEVQLLGELAFALQRSPPDTPPEVAQAGRQLSAMLAEDDVTRKRAKEILHAARPAPAKNQ